MQSVAFLLGHTAHVHTFTCIQCMYNVHTIYTQAEYCQSQVYYSTIDGFCLIFEHKMRQ